MSSDQKGDYNPLDEYAESGFDRFTMMGSANRSNVDADDYRASQMINPRGRTEVTNLHKLPKKAES